MVEINNRNVRRSSICWRGRRELITDVRKPEIMVMTSLYAESYLPITRSPRKLVTLNPKLKSTGCRRYQLLSRWWDAYRKQLGLKDFPKARDAVALQQIKERGALPMIDRGDIRQVIDRYCAISGLHCRALVMVVSSIRLTAWLQNSKKRAERSERLM